MHCLTISFWMSTSTLRCVRITECMSRSSNTRQVSAGVKLKPSSLAAHASLTEPPCWPHLPCTLRLMLIFLHIQSMVFEYNSCRGSLCLLPGQKADHGASQWVSTLTPSLLSFPFFVNESHYVAQTALGLAAELEFVIFRSQHLWYLGLQVCTTKSSHKSKTYWGIS